MGICLMKTDILQGGHIYGDERLAIMIIEGIIELVL